MRHLARHLLLVLALLFAQQGALLHELEHATHEIGIAGLDHEVAKCIAYDAVGHALDGSVSLPAPSLAPSCVQVVVERPSSVATRVVFDSRAPPYSA